MKVLETVTSLNSELHGHLQVGGSIKSGFIVKASSGEVSMHEVLGKPKPYDSVLVVGTVAELSSDNRKSKPQWKQSVQS